MCCQNIEDGTNFNIYSNRQALSFRSKRTVYYPAGDLKSYTPTMWEIDGLGNYSGACKVWITVITLTMWSTSGHINSLVVVRLNGTSKMRPIKPFIFRPGPNKPEVTFLGPSRILCMWAWVYGPIGAWRCDYEENIRDITGPLMRIRLKPTQADSPTLMDCFQTCNWTNMAPPSFLLQGITLLSMMQLETCKEGGAQIQRLPSDLDSMSYARHRQRSC